MGRATAGPRGGGGRLRSGERNGAGEERCGRCGGWLYPERLAESTRRMSIWELTCLSCGQTYYPSDGSQATVSGRTGAGKWERR